MPYDAQPQTRSGHAASRPSRADRIKSSLLYPIPHHLVSRLLFWATRRRLRLNRLIIRWFARHYGVDLAEAAQPDPAAYATFNDFFTRALRDGARPVDPATHSLASPADATVSELGRLSGERIVQAKGVDYTVSALLGGHIASEPFVDGSFVTLYLSPRDYHRVHMPLAGTLRTMSYVPGRLFSVAPHTVRTVPGLFTRNERVAALFDTAAGPLALVLVGAINVAAIETVWSGLITPPRGRRAQHWDYPAGHVTLPKGAEMGRFNMGSTVIVLTQGRLGFDPALRPGSPVRLGEALASFTDAGAR